MEINDQNYAEIMAQGKPVVLDFWATWCGPCKAIAPFVEELAEEYKDKVIIGKVNVEESEDLTDKYGVRNIPSLFFIGADGQVKDKFVGGTTKDVIEGKVKALL